jgi:hypothetical protein
MSSAFATAVHPERCLTLMEDSVMKRPSKLHVKFWGVSVSADGALAIGAALFIVLAFIASYRF